MIKVLNILITAFELWIKWKSIAKKDNSAKLTKKQELAHEKIIKSIDDEEHRLAIKLNGIVSVRERAKAINESINRDM